MAVRREGNQTLTYSTAPPVASHIRRGPAFIKKDKATRVYSFELLVPLLALRLDIGAVLLGGVERFFLSDSCKS